MSRHESHLSELYPFLHGGKQSADNLHTALLESVKQKSAHGIEIKQKFFADNSQALVHAARAVARVYLNAGRWFAMGNGGSSCDAARFTVAFLHPVTGGRPSLPAINLAGDNAMATAVGNDAGFDNIFVRQVVAHGRAGDGLVGFSCSGNSPNLLKAFAKAREIGMTTIGFSGGNGGKMATSGDIDHCMTVPADNTHRIQEVQVATYHILWDLVHALLAKQRGGLGHGGQGT